MTTQNQPKPSSKWKLGAGLVAAFGLFSATLAGVNLVVENPREGRRAISDCFNLHAQSGFTGRPQTAVMVAGYYGRKALSCTAIPGVLMGQMAARAG